MIHFKKDSVKQHGQMYIMYFQEIQCGFCTFMFDSKKPNLVNILVLQIGFQYRGRGYGTMLLKEVLQDAYRQGKTRVELCDGSERCRKAGNIYKNMGLSYIHREYDPENSDMMTGNLRHMLFGRVMKHKAIS